MKSRIVAAVAVAALALGSITATPAAALGKNERDALKFALGAVALGLIIKEIDDNKKKKKGKHRYGAHGGKVIPEACVYDIRTRDGLREVVSARCVAEFGVSGRLPEACAFDIRTDGGHRTVYGPRCLREYGYRVGDARY